MPEGDTLFRAARAIGAKLDGQVVTAFHSNLGAQVNRGRVGRTIERVLPHGKNLLVVFDDRWTLHTHLRMSGVWRVVPAATFHQRPLPPTARVVIEVEGWVAVCYRAPIVRMVRGDARAQLALGPDLLAAEFDEAEAVRRVHGADLAIGEAIMAQRLVAGIGNVYKSEVLFLEGVDPFVPAASLPAETIGKILRRARALLQANVARGVQQRTTRGSPRRAGRSGRVWVYGRSGEPCYKCGTRIGMRRQIDGRSTYFCRECQVVPT